MKPGVSTLNPYAASYIPLSKREMVEKIEVPGAITKVSHSGNQSVWYGPAEHTTQSRLHDQSSSITQVPMRQGLSAHGFSGSSNSQNEMTEKQMMDEESDMALEYLKMTFPGMSDESLNDVYLANKGDLEATIDMLTQLEYPFESPENLPDTLDIGDVTESGSSAECSSVKLKNVVEGEASASSSSGSAASESVTVNL